MKLIIDIKDNYKSLITSAWSYGVAPSRSVLEDISKAVMNGTVLPEQHGRLIDESQIVGCEWDGKQMKCNAPTILERTVKE